MIKRILLGFAFTASILWIGFSIFQKFQQGENVSINSVFNKTDENVLVINRFDEFSTNLIPNWSDFKSSEWLEFLPNDNIQQIAFSKNENKVLFQFKSTISNRLIKSIFGSKATFSFGKIKSINGIKAIIQDNLLLLTSSAKQRKKQNFYFDKKASACLIKFSDKDIEVTDIYSKNEGKVEYLHSKNDQSYEKINDAEYFAFAIPNSIQSYWFREKNYALFQDKTLQKSPIKQWLNRGFVEMDFEGQKIILTDYNDGKDPHFILQNIELTSDTNWFSTPLTSTFPKKSKYVIKPLDEFMVISENERACDQFIAKYKVGKTLALSTQNIERIYGNLPQKVSERFISGTQKWTTSTYNGKRLTTVLNGKTKTVKITKQDVISMSVNFDIQDFQPLKGIGNVVVTGKKGEISTFLNQKIAWTKKIDEILSLEIVDFLGNNQEQILISTENKIHLLDKQGNEINGFPISIESSITTTPKFYRWKGEPFVLVATSDNEIIQFDARGRERNIWEIGQKVTKPIQVWSSQRKLFWGAYTDTEFIMFHVKNQKQHRRFTVQSDAFAIKIPNQLIHFQINKGKLQKVDQKGTITEIKSISNGKILNQNNNENFAVKNHNEILLFNSQGIAFSEFKIPFNEFSKAKTIQLKNGKTIILILDELQNNIYIYQRNGVQKDSKNWEGQQKVIPSENNKTLILTTKIDQFVIQYTP